MKKKGKSILFVMGGSTPNTHFITPTYNGGLWGPHSLTSGGDYW
ncbi:hypothetical protein [Candidatus Lokiarchaeum ossiferum]